VDRVYVTGSGIAPKLIFCKQSITLMQALAQAGLSNNAKVERIIIYRFVHDDIIGPLEANLKEIKKGRQLDISLRSYDVIDVPSENEGEVSYPKRVKDIQYPLPIKAPIRIIN